MTLADGLPTSDTWGGWRRLQAPPAWGSTVSDDAPPTVMSLALIEHLRRQRCHLDGPGDAECGGARRRSARSLGAGSRVNSTPPSTCRWRSCVSCSTWMPPPSPLPCASVPGRDRAGARGSTPVVLWLVRSEDEMLPTGLAAVWVIRRGRVESLKTGTRRDRRAHPTCAWPAFVASTYPRSPARARAAARRVWYPALVTRAPGLAPSRS